MDFPTYKAVMFSLKGVNVKDTEKTLKKIPQHFHKLLEISHTEEHIPIPVFMTENIEEGMEIIKQLGVPTYLEKGAYGMWYEVDTTTNNVLSTFNTIKEVAPEYAESIGSSLLYRGKHYIKSLQIKLA